jgi:hypothetical protein
MQIISLQDFESGKFAISTNQYTTADLVKYGDTYELNYLEDLLGVELAKLLLADLVNGVPQTQRFIDIFNRISMDYEQSGDGCVLRSEGIPAILIGFVWCEFVKDQNAKNTIAGTTQNEQEVSKVMSFRNAQFIERYNTTLNSYTSLQIYIAENITVYPEFNGMMKRPKTII